MTKVRLRFDKLGKVRWTSHRDVARMWERALRRAGLPVAYTEGFSPRPRLAFGLALPTGCESTAEYLDVALSAPVDVDGLAARLSPLLPDGVDVTATAVLDVGAPSLQQDVTSCSWEVAVPGLTAGELAERVTATLAAATLPVERERKGRVVVDDLRPSIGVLVVEDLRPSIGAPAVSAGAGPGACMLRAELGTRPRGVRPAELAQVLGVTLGPARRTHQWIERDGSRTEPLTVVTSMEAAALGCAS